MPVFKDSKLHNMDFIEVEEFLRNPPSGFIVEQRGLQRGAGYRLVKTDPESCCVLIDDFESSKGKVIFQNSPGSKITVRNLGDYTNVRRHLTSKRIYILVSACFEKPPPSDKKTRKSLQVVQRFVVVINASHPLIKWDMERGLDQTISSVAGESYRVDIDLSTALQSWAGESFHILVDGEKVRPIWRDTCFTLKYYSDALFDFPHWLGFSKRQFKAVPLWGPAKITQRFLETAVMFTIRELRSLTMEDVSKHFH